MTKSISKHANQDIVDSSLEAFGPLTSQTLFWRARYLAESPSIELLPLLFWLTENAHPAIAVTLGINDAVPHFALCQAVEKLNLETMCVGLDLQDEATEAAPSDLTAIKAHNKQHYSDFSLLAQTGQEQAMDLVEGTQIDLLVVNQPASRAVQDDLDRYWLPLLSDRGVIVFLQGGDRIKDYLVRIPQNAGQFTLDTEKGIHLVLCGSQHNDRLVRLCQIKIGKPGYMAVRNVFARTGELHLKTYEADQLHSEVLTARKDRVEDVAQRGKLAKKLTEQEDLLTTVTTQLKEKNVLLGSVRAELFDLQKTTEDEKSATQAKIKALTTERDAAKTDAEAKAAAHIKTTEQANALTQDRDTARAEVEQIKTALSEAQTKAAEQAEALTQARDTARAEVEQFKTALSEAQAKAAEQAEALTQDRDAARAEVEQFKTTLSEAQTKAAEQAEALTQARDTARAEVEQIKIQSEERLKLQVDTFNAELGTLRENLDGKTKAEELLTTQIDMLIAEQKTLDARCVNAESNLADRLDDISVLGNEFSKTEEELHQSRAQVTALTAELTALRSTHDTEYKALQSALDAQTKAQERFKAESVTLASERESLRTRLQQAETGLKDRLDDISILGQELQKVSQESQQSRAKAAQHLKALEDMTRDINSTIAAQRLDLDRKHQDLEETRRALQEAEQARDEAQHRVRDLEHSTSWRVTSPLRTASRMVRSDRGPDRTGDT